MKAFLFSAFALLVAFSLAMMATREAEGTPGKVTLTWVTDKSPQRDEQMALFRKENPALDIRLDPGNTDTQKVIVQSQAGVGPDLFDFWGEGNFRAYVKSGIAWDVTDELAKRGIDFKGSVWPLAIPWTVSDEGRVHAVPANVGLDAIWFHKTMFDEAGVAYPKAPWTIDEIVATAKRLTKRDRNGRVSQFGLLMDFGGGYRAYLPSFGGALFDPTGRRCTVASAESIACLEWMHSLIYTHRVSPSPNDEQAMTTGGAWGGTGPQAYFRKPLGAMAMGGRWWLAQLRNDIAERGFRLGAVPPPVAKYNRFGGGGTRATMINAKSPHREEALEFLVYLLKEPYNTLLNDQGDALSGVRGAAFTDRYVNNPRDPGEDFHAAFRTTLGYAVPLPNSPYISQSEFDTYLNRQLDLVKLNQKPAGAALRDAAREIDNLPADAPALTDAGEYAAAMLDRIAASRRSHRTPGRH